MGRKRVTPDEIDTSLLVGSWRRLVLHAPHLEAGLAASVSACTLAGAGGWSTAEDLARYLAATIAGTTPGAIVWPALWPVAAALLCTGVTVGVLRAPHPPLARAPRPRLRWTTTVGIAAAVDVRCRGDRRRLGRRVEVW